MKDETRILLDKMGIAAGFLLIILAIVGEVLGWWNDLGLLVGVAGLALGILALLDVNGFKLLRRFDRQERRQDQTLVKQDQTLVKQDQMLSKQDTTNVHLERIVTLLDQRLPASGR